MTEYYLWLLQLMGTANPKSLQLIQHYGSVKEAYISVNDNKQTDLLTSAEKKKLSGATLENSQRIIGYCNKKGIKIVTIDDKNYPYRLKNIYNPPVLLFYKGNIDGLNDEICVCGVGARSATEYTAKITRRTCTDLAKIGVVLISGMAVGVDHIVHQSAIETNSRTIGVLACGLDVDYPKGSISTRERIYQNNGACISELFPHENTSRTYFQARNRILSGLSMGVIIFQAGLNSGSLITAAHAIQQGRDLFCVPPHDIFSADYSGVIGFLRDGATPLFNHLDVVNAFYNDFADKSALIDTKTYSVNPEKHFIFSRNEKNESTEKTERKATSAIITENEQNKKEIDVSSYSEEHKKIIDLLKSGRKTLEAITTGTDISPADISEYLVDLEIDGIISASAGANYELNN